LIVKFFLDEHPNAAHCIRLGERSPRGKNPKVQLPLKDRCA